MEQILSEMLETYDELKDEIKAIGKDFERGYEFTGAEVDMKFRAEINEKLEMDLYYKINVYHQDGENCVEREGKIENLELEYDIEDLFRELLEPMFKEVVEVYDEINKQRV